MRQYSKLDLIRFKNLSQEHPELKNFELVKLYDTKHPEKTAKEQLINISKALDLNGLHKSLTGEDIPEDNEPILNQ